SPSRRPAVRRNQPGAGQVGARAARADRLRARAAAPDLAHARRHREDHRIPRCRRTLPVARRRLHSERALIVAHFVPDGLPSSIQHYIGGEFVDSASGATFDVLDPVTNQTYATAAAGQKADIDRAVNAATTAFRSGPWPGLAPRARARILNHIADAVQA